MNFDEIKKLAFVDELEKLSASPQAPASIFPKAHKELGQIAKNDVNRYTRTFGNAGKRVTPSLPKTSASSSSSSGSSSSSSMSTKSTTRI